MQVRRAQVRFLCLVCLLCFLCFLSAQEPVVRFAVIGDSGTGDEHQYRIAQQMVAWHDRLPYDLVLMLGDNIYGAFWGGGNQKYFQERFDRPYAALLARGVIFRATLGNHDTRHRDGQDLIESYERFHIEGAQGYYSFTAGEWLPAGSASPSPAPSPVAPATGTPGPTSGLTPSGQKPSPLIEFFVINTVRLEEDKQDPEQLAWLQQALEDSRARWRIVYGHHPTYSTGKRHGADLKLRTKLEPLLTGAIGGAPFDLAQGKQGPALPKPAGVGEGLVPSRSSVKPLVHVVLAGHDHIYQRFHPQHGIVYFVCGSSGKLRRGNAEPDAQLAAAEDGKHAFMLWEASAEQLQFRAIDEEGRVFDCGTITRDADVLPQSCPEP